MIKFWFWVGCLGFFSVFQSLNANPYVYVGNRDSNSISVINIPTNTIYTTITLGGQPSLNTAYGQFLFQLVGSNLIVIDATSNTITSTIALPSFGNRVAATSVNGQTYCYVMTYEGPDQGRFLTINPITSTIVSVITIPGQTRGTSCGTFNGVPYASLGNNVRVITINLETYQFVSTVTFTTSDTVTQSISNLPYVYVITQNGNGELGKLITVDVMGSSVIATVSLGLYPMNLTFGAINGGSYVYVSAYTTPPGYLSVVNVDNFQLVSKTTVPGGFRGVCLAQNGGVVYEYVALGGNNTVAVFDTVTNNIRLLSKLKI